MGRRWAWDTGDVGAAPGRGTPIGGTAAGLDDDGGAAVDARPGEIWRCPAAAAARRLQQLDDGLAMAWTAQDGRLTHDTDLLVANARRVGMHHGVQVLLAETQAPISTLLACPSSHNHDPAERFRGAANWFLTGWFPRAAVETQGSSHATG